MRSSWSRVAMYNWLTSVRCALSCIWGRSFVQKRLSWLKRAKATRTCLPILVLQKTMARLKMVKQRRNTP